MKKSNIHGITLVTLIITIIVMIIIAGVSISSILGNDDAIDKATEAKMSEQELGARSILEQALLKYNSGNYFFDITDEELNEKKATGESLENCRKRLEITRLLAQELKIREDYVKLCNGNSTIYLFDLDGDGQVEDDSLPNDAKTDIEAKCIVEEDFWKIDEFGIKILPKAFTGITSSSNVVVADSGKSMEFKDNDNYTIFAKPGETEFEELDFNIPANTTVSITIASPMEISNQEKKRAAINLNENSVLNLTVNSNVTVNSTFGENGAISDSKQVESQGGYAGIRVPDTATLNLSGTGTIYCYGGNAGAGGTFTGTSHSGGSGGGGAGAGIGGNGGNGGAGKSGASNKGLNGENCGTVNINGTLTVYAYGGAGGAGGIGNCTKNSAGTVVNGGGRWWRISWSWNWRRRCWRPEEELVAVEQEVFQVALQN